MSIFLPKVIGALALATMLSSSPGLAQSSKANNAWCNPDLDGAMNCRYRTEMECEMVVISEGGECVQNPRANFMPLEELDD